MASTTPPTNMPPQLKNDPRLATMLQRHNSLRQQGFTEETSEELRQYSSFIKVLQRQEHQSKQQQQTPTSTKSEADNLLNGTIALPDSSSTTLASLPPPPAPEPLALTPHQLRVLQAQIKALQLVSRGQPIPQDVHETIYVSEEAAAAALAKREAAAKAEAEAAALQAEKEKEDSPESSLVLPKGTLLEFYTSSAIYPYNASLPPQHGMGAHIAAGTEHRVIAPTLMPTGLDPHDIATERQRLIDARIEHRIEELSALSSTISDGTVQDPLDLSSSAPQLDSSTKLRALIELKALRLRDKQRALRSSIVNRMLEASSLSMDRKAFRKTRRPDLRNSRQTEQLERQQRLERERRAKQKHLDYLHVICEHGNSLINAGRNSAARMSKLGRTVQKLHIEIEKEEQKRVERLAKERLKALKADDEEAYMKLIDTAKDTRITHLLRQTDSFLEKLAQNVRKQQGIRGPIVVEKPVDETEFGASKPQDDEEGPSKVDYYSVAHRIQEKITAQPSILVGGTLKEYQIKGLQWMVSLYNNGLNGILADEMGLGKTIQTISLITFLVEIKRRKGPYLVIVPLSTLTNWTLEFKKWAPALSVLIFKGSPNQRRNLAPQIRAANFQVLLTTYEYIIRERAVLGKVRWLHMIIDEGHRMKNTNSKLSQTLSREYSTEYRLILTGTPLQNNLTELWSILNFVLPSIFNSAQSFDEWFNTPFANSGSQDKLELTEEEALLLIRRLHKVLRPFLLRRLKKDVESELPDKVEKVVKCKMSGLQYQLYQQMKKHGILFDDEVKGKQVGIKGLNNTIMQFRKICQHPFVFPQIEDRINPSRGLNSTIIRSAGKVALLDQLLPKLFATGHRVLMFFQMTNVMDILGDYFQYRGYKFFRLDGSTKPEDRAQLLVQFNDPNTDVHLFMLSTRAGGLGLNLQTADTVIIYDSDWNPHADLQAQDRAHRIGQKKDVRIFRFVTEKSIEEVMLARARSKLDMDGKVIQAGRFDNKSTAEEQEEYLRSLLDQDQEDDSEESASMNDDEINDIVARTEEETMIFRRMDVERAFAEEQEWRAEGNTGPVPDRLMQVHELPEIYQRDEPLQQEVQEDLPQGRGARVRNTVKYNEGLNDEWAEALEDEDEEPVKRSRNRKRVESSPELELSDPDEEWGSAPTTRRGRASRSKVKKAPSPPPLKRKRTNGKAPSLTPSGADDDEEIPDTKRRKTQTLAPGVIPPATRERMKKAFNECYKAVQSCMDEDRQRCELFKELPNRKEYPDYYQQIRTPIAMSHIRKRSATSHYKTVTQYAEDWRLMFANARQYNQEGSWVYNDALELSKVFEEVFARETGGTDLPGALPTANAASSSTAPYNNNNAAPFNPQQQQQQQQWQAAQHQYSQQHYQQQQHQQMYVQQQQQQQRLYAQQQQQMYAQQQQQQQMQPPPRRAPARKKQDDEDWGEFSE